MRANRPPRAYIETSVWNFQFADDAMEKKQATQQFFEEARQGRFELYASDIVLQELRAANEPRRSILLGFFEQVSPTLLDVSEEAVELSQEYVRAEVVPSKYLNDALHVAIASVEEIDIILSWNMKHIVKRKTRERVNAINVLAGYAEIAISTPEEETTDAD